MGEGGFISLYRKFINWEWWDDPNMIKAFIYLLLRANYKDTKYRGMTLKRGQLITGRKKLSTELKMGEQVVRTILNRLKSTGEITIKSTSRFSIITVCNYDSYQKKDNDGNQQTNQQTNQQLTNKQPTTNQQLTTSNKENNNNKENKVNKLNKNRVAKNATNKANISKIMATIFDEHFEKHFGRKFDWKTSTGKKFNSLKSLRGAIGRQIENQKNQKPSEEDITEGWNHFLMVAAEIDNGWYLQNHFTPSGLLSQFDKIIQKYHAGKTNDNYKNRKQQVSEFKKQLDEIIRQAG